MSTRVRISGALLPVLLLVLWLVLLSGALLPGPASAQEQVISTGQVLYVPVYGHIYHGAQKKPFYLTTTLSVRNTDPTFTVEIVQVDYYDTEGRLLTRYLEEPVALPPMATLEVVVQEKEDDAGSGDNFVVRWRSDKPVNAPLVEAVMIGTASAQGISFTSRGVVIQD